MKDARSNVWTEAEAIENVRALFDAVRSGKPQRVRMPDLADIVLTLEQTDADADKSLAALLRRPKYPEGTD